jgi:Uma2 family endonuclease
MTMQMTPEMTVQMTPEMTIERVGMPLETFLEDQLTQPFELIKGERFTIMPTVFRHSFIGHFLYDYIRDVFRHTQWGVILMETTFIVSEFDDPNWVKGSRVPDLMIYAKQRLDDWRRDTPDNRPLNIVPDLVIEILSPNDIHLNVRNKVNAYLSDGVNKVIVIDPDHYEAWLYTLEGGTIVGRNGVLDLTDVIPDLNISMRDIFAE